MFKFNQKNKTEKTYMEQLDEWIEYGVINPLFEAWSAYDRGGFDPSRAEGREMVIGSIKKAVREKVLESYRNGQRAQPARAYQRS